jgi:hypothetical protein
VAATGTRRIWHAEARGLCAELAAAGAWQTALRLRLAQREALARRPNGTAFDYRATAEDDVALGATLARLRATRSVRGR